MADNALLGLTLNQFLDRLSADEPTPGGGSVAALVGALAAGLGHMSCAFTIGRPKFASVEPRVQEIALRLERAGCMLRRLVDEDSEAYAGLSEAFKLEKTDPQRKRAISKAASVAAGVPFQTAALSRQVLSDLEALSAVANPRLRSDVDAGVCLAKAAIEASIANVRINLPYMEPEDAARIDHEMRRLFPDV